MRATLALNGLNNTDLTSKKKKKKQIEKSLTPFDGRFQ